MEGLWPRDFHSTVPLGSTPKRVSLPLHSELLAPFGASRQLPFSPSTLATFAAGSASSLADSASFAQASAAVGDQVPQSTAGSSRNKRGLLWCECRLRGSRLTSGTLGSDQVQRGQSLPLLLRGQGVAVAWVLPWHSLGSYGRVYTRSATM